MPELSEAMRKDERGTTGISPMPQRAAARFCILSGFLLLLASVVVLCCCDIDGLAVEQDDLDFETDQAYMVIAMLMPLMVFEPCHSASWKGHRVENDRDQILVFASAGNVGKLVGCLALAWSGWAARPVVRCIERWLSTAVVLAVGNGPAHCTSTRLSPSFFAMLGYSLAVGVADEVASALARRSLLGLAFVAQSVVAWDQAELAVEADFPHGVGFAMSMKLFLASQGVICVLRAADVVSAASASSLHLHADVAMKVAQAVMRQAGRCLEMSSHFEQVSQQITEFREVDVKRLFRNTRVPVFAVSEDGTVAAWNERLAQESGILPERAVGQELVDLVEARGRVALKAAVESCWSGLTSTVVDVRFPRQSDDQEPARFLFTLVTRLGQDGRCTTIVAVGHEIDALATKTALEARRARFIALSRAGLRRPLQGIVGLAASMGEGVGGKERRQLGMIGGCASRLADLVRNIEEFAREDTLGTTNFERVPLNIADIVADAVRIAEAAMDKSGRRILRADVVLHDGTSAGELPLVVGDYRKVAQLFRNVILNAANYTTAGSIRISAREGSPRGFLEIDVADTGEGIPPEKLRKIFEPFQQEEGKDSRSLRGIGIGLPVAQHLARLHDGDVTVASERGSGTTVTIRLPCDLGRKAGRTHHGTMLRRAVSGSERPFAASALVLHLVGNGEESSVEVERAIGADRRLVRVRSGREAAAYLDSGLPAFVLLEVCMAWRSPFLDFIAEVRERRALSHVQLPVLVLSSCSSDSDITEEAFRVGATDVLQRPFGSGVLKGRLRRFDALRRARTCEGQLRRLGPVARLPSHCRLPAEALGLAGEVISASALPRVAPPLSWVPRAA